MNQRAKDIVKSSGVIVSIDESQVIVPTIAELNKLIELIVKDCAGVADNASDRRLPASTYGTLIKKHFGV